MSGIFISYRRDDSRGTAGRLYDDLRDHFGKGRVFRDLDAIKPGADYAVAIDEFLDSCEAVVIVIGNQWLDIRNDEGRRRLTEPSDLVRQEVAAALNTGKPVIPVLVEEAQMPTASKLPRSLAALARRNALPMSDARWDYDVGRLLTRLEEVLPAGSPTVPVTAPGDEPAPVVGARVPPSWEHPADPPPPPATTSPTWSGGYAWQRPASAPPPSPAPPAGSSGGSGARAMWLAGAAALVLVLGAVVWVAARGGQSGDDPDPNTTLTSVGTPPQTTRIPPTTIPTSTPTSDPPETPAGEVTVTLSRSSGPVGTAITVSGQGFDPTETIEISFHVQELATKVTDARGAFSGVVIRVPAGSFNGFPYQVRATGKRSLKSDGAPFTVT